MKFTKKFKCMIARCIILCMLLPQLLTIFAYAENSVTTLKVGNHTTPLSIQPYVNDLGIMLDASELTEAFGLSCQLDAENKSFTIFDEKHGEIVLMHNATKFYSGEHLYSCEPYFYLENTIPMVELGFFCEMFDSSYSYDEQTNTISVDRGKISDQTPKIKVGDKIVSVMNEPFVGEYGLVAGAEDIANAFGMAYTYDEASETATFYDEKHGNVVLKNRATSFQSGETEYKCLAYFYVSNGIPVITVDFFCRMYGLEYQYDKAAKTLELLASEELMAADDVSLFSTPTISGNITYAPGVPDEPIPVKLVLQPFFKIGIYENIVSDSKIELGTVTLQPGTTSKSYQYEIPGVYAYFYLYYEAPSVGKYGYYSEQGTTIQTTKAPEPSTTNTAKRFLSDSSARANLVIDYNRVYGTITLDEKPPENGLDVKLILQQGDARDVKYGKPYLVPGETYTLGNVHFNSSETQKEYSYITTEYYSEQYPYYSLFYEAPAISKYGYYNNAMGTAVLDKMPDYQDSEWFSAAPCAVIPLSSKKQLDLNIKSTINLNGAVSVDTTSAIPSAGLDVTLYLKSVKQHQNIYNGQVTSTFFYTDKTYELGTVSLTQQNSVASFAYDTSAFSTAPYYYLFYRVNNAQDSIAAAGFMNTNGNIEGIISLDRYSGSPMRYSATETVNVNFQLPSLEHKPCGPESYWTLDAETGTLHIKGTGAVTNNTYILLSEYIKTVKVSPGITSISASMPMNMQYLYLPDTVTTIGNNICTSCNKLTEIIYSGSQDEWNAIHIGTGNDYFTSANVTWLNSDDVAIIYYGNGGSDTPESAETKQNTSVELSSAVPKREGFTFLGWATTPEATIPDYKPGQTVAVGNSHLHLYAVWDADLVDSGTCGDNLSWFYYNGGLLEIKGTGDMYDYKSNVNIPWYNMCSDITSVVIGEGVTTIGVFAFYGCDNLTSIKIPDSVSTLGNYAFASCRNLTGIEIPDSVTTIGKGAFDSCSKLSAISVSENNQAYFADEDGVLFNKDKTTLVMYPAGKTQTEYIIPDGVATIGNSAFYYCHNLTDIEIPDSVTTIGKGAFGSCSKLSAIKVSGNNQAYFADENGVLFNKDKTTLVNYPAGKTQAEYNIPDSVTTIADYAFNDCYSLTSITIPDSVTTIGDYAFAYCHNLNGIEIPGNVTTIGNSAFYYCDSLTNIPIPNSVTSIGNFAFAYCDSLTNITIPGSVTKIGNYSFNGCDSLTNIIIPDSIASIGDSAFYGCDSLTEVYYMNAEENWKKISIGSKNNPLTDCTICFVPKGNVAIIYHNN